MGVGLYPIPMLGGVNLFTHPTALAEDEIVRSKNMAPVNHKRMSKRLGTGYLGGCDNVASFQYPLAGVPNPLPSAGLSWDVVCLFRGNGTETLHVSAIIIGQIAGELIDSLKFYSQRPWMFSLGQSVYVLAGPNAIPVAPTVTAPAGWIVSQNTSGIGYTISDFAFTGTGNETVRPKVSSPYKQRVVYANFGAGYENTVLFSNNNQPLIVGNSVLAVNGRGISLVPAQDGDEIVALVEVMLFNVGSPAASALLILRKFGNPFLLTGEPEQLDGSLSPSGTSTLDIKRISVNAGCANPYTVARTPYGIIWAGQDDVWCFDYGTVRNVGLKIQPALRVSPPDQHIWWSGAFHNGFYRLAIWGEGQDFAFPNAPSDQWWLHLDGGLPKDWQDAEWFGPQQFATNAGDGSTTVHATRAMFPETRIGKVGRLFGLEMGSNGGGVGNEIVLIEYDVTKGRDLASNPTMLAAADTDGCEIEGLIVSREMDVAENYIKASDGVQATIRPDKDITLNLAIIPDAGEDKQEITKSLNPGGFRTNSSILNTDRIGESKPVPFSIYANAGDRPLGTTFQFELGDVAQNTTYTIGSGNDSLVVGVTDDGSVPAPDGPYYQWIATVTHGTYTLAQLCTALQTAINSGLLFGGVWTVSIVGGLVRFAASSLLGSSISIYIQFASDVGPPDSSAPDFGTIPTTAQFDASYALGQILGLDTSGVGLASLSDLSVNIDATTGDFTKSVAHYELWGLKANIETFPRDP